MHICSIYNRVAQATLGTRYVLSKHLVAAFLLLGGLLINQTLTAQDQFLWLGASTGVWENPNNWAYYPYGGSTRIYPAPFFPGQGGSINPNGPKDDIAVFTAISNVPCNITSSHTGTTGALRVGGLHIQGYEGTLTQNNGNRFIVTESADAGGVGFWDGSTLIASGHPELTLVNGNVAYQARFNFGPTGEFIGGGNIVGGIVPSYALLFGVPLSIENGRFAPPEDETRIRNHASINIGPLFDHLFHQGTVVLSNRTGGLGIRQYSFPNVHFWNLKVTPNGAAPRTKEFVGGTCVVDNDFSTTGLLGALYDSSETIIMNATPGVEVQVKNDIILGNIAINATLTAADAYGDLVIVMNGNGNQNIDHSHADIDFQGNLPYLKIDKPSGQVTLLGPVTVNGNIDFVAGRVRPATPSSQSALTTDVFVLNSNTTVSNMSDASFCTGAIRVRTGKTIELPIGKGTTYRPALVRAVSGVSIDNSIQNMYRAEYFEATPVEPTSSVELGVLNQVSNCEVWAIQKEAGDAPDPWTFDLELSYDPATGSECTDFLYPATNPCLAVSRWDHDVQWVSHGNDGAFVTSHGDETVRSNLAIVSSDFKRSDLINRPDLFTFGELETALCAATPCEVHVCVDYCQIGDSVEFKPNIVYGTGSSFAGIFWDFGDGTTSTDLLPTHAFASSGVHFVDVTVFAVSGGDTCSTTYTFGIFYNDCSLPTMEVLPAPPSNTSETIQTIPSRTALSITPNPASNGRVQFLLESDQEGTLDYIITNKLGQTVHTGQLRAQEQATFKTTSLPIGIYTITVKVGEKAVSQQFVINR